VYRVNNKSINNLEDLERELTARNNRILIEYTDRNGQRSYKQYINGW
jgi:hypothetical protein